VGAITDYRDGTSYYGPPLSNRSSFTYDPLGRLTVADLLAPSASDTYDFDQLGNLSRINNQAVTYSTSSAPHRALGHDGYELAYDANGMRTFKGRFNPVQFDFYDWHTLAYDRMHRAWRLQVGNSSTADHTIDYAYDYNDRRVRKKVDSASPVLYFSNLTEYTDGELTKYYFLGDRLIATRFDSAANLSQLLAGRRLRPPDLVYVPRPLVIGGVGISLLLFLVLIGPRRIRVGVALAPSRISGSILIVMWGLVPASVLIPEDAEANWCGVPGVIRHYHPDHLGSAQAISDNSGTLQFQIRYSPYGEVRGRFDLFGTPQAPSELYRSEFTTYESEHISGLSYAGARFYDSKLGQFIGHDPAGQFASPYAYGPGDPLNTIDPGGTFAINWGWVVAALLVASVVTAVAQAVYVGITTGNGLQALSSLVTSGVFIGAGYALGGLAAGIVARGFGEAGKWAMLGVSVGYGGYSLGSSAASGDAFGAINSAIGLLSLAAGYLEGRAAASGESSRSESGENLSQSDYGPGDNHYDHDQLGRVTGPYNEDRPSGPHTGTDLRGAPGDPVYAPLNGQVQHAGPARGYGGAVVIGGDLAGDGSRLFTVQGHINAEVEAGAYVFRGDRIGNVAAPGTPSFGSATDPHIHLGLYRFPSGADWAWRSSYHINPETFNWSGVR